MRATSRACFLRIAVTLGLLVAVSTSCALSAERIKLTFWTWEPLEPTVKAFEERFPNVEVNLVKMGVWDIHDKLLVALASGKGAPDVVELVGRRFSSYTRTGRLLDMTRQLGKYQKDFVKTSWENVMYKGKVYGLPYDYMPAVVYYRVDVFDRYGIDPKKIVTWDEFIAAGQELARHGHAIAPVFVPAGQWGANCFVLYLQSRGVNIFDEDGNVIRNNKEAAATLEWYLELATKYKVAKPMKFFEPEFWAAFNDDAIVAWPMNPAEAASLRSEVKLQAGKWGIMPFPLWSKDAPKSTGEWGGAVFTAPAQTQHPNEAMAFIEFATTRIEGAVASWQASCAWPSYIPAQRAIKDKDPWFSDYFTGSPTLVEAIEARTPPTFYRHDWARVEAILGEAIDAVFSGRKSCEDAWMEVERKLEAR